MYAVVEFPKRECVIVSLICLINDRTKCYWPRNTNAKMIQDTL